MHFYHRSAKMSGIHITKELTIHFPLFNCSFKLSGSLDILILPYGVLKFNKILAPQKLWFFFYFYQEKVLWFLSHIKIKKVGNYGQVSRGLSHNVVFLLVLWFDITHTNTHIHKDTQHFQGPVHWHTHINIYLHHLLCAQSSYLYYNEDLLSTMFFLFKNYSLVKVISVD